MPTISVVDPEKLQEILENQQERIEHLANLWSALVEALSQSNALSLTLLQKEMLQRFPEPRPGSIFHTAYQETTKMAHRNSGEE